MLSVEWPWLFCLLPLPWLLRWWLPEQASNQQAIRVPFFAALQHLNQAQTQGASKQLSLALIMGLIWLCLLTAAARPNWIGDPVALPQERRDLMLAVDISMSMREVDMQVRGGYTNRITAVKAVVGDFIQQRAGDRIGLILFGEQAYLQTPLTHDTQTVNQQLQEAQLGIAGNATAIGDAIGMAIKKLRDRPAESRILVLLTDGANTAGSDPSQATNIAAEANIRIHTVGIGAQSRGRGNQLDEKSLTMIANNTGGRYFRARNPSELQQIYAELDRLEPMPEEQTFRPTRSLSHWPLGLALLFSILMALSLLLKTWWSSRPSNTSSEKSI